MGSFIPTDGLAEEFSRAGKSHLLLHSRAVGLYGLHTDTKCLSNLPRALSLAEQFEDFQLAVAELFDGRTAHGPLALEKSPGSSPPLPSH